MNRSPLMDRFGLRSKASNRSRASETRLSFEPLEERRLLSASDLVITTVDGFVNGNSVLRYNEATKSPVAGSVAYGAGNALYYATGVAVAPDGSYYVSSFGTGVLHFGDSGQLVGVLGTNVLVAPGALEFGPNGNLYVSDLEGGASMAGSIDQFDTATQQMVATQDLASTCPEPAGFTFATDGTNDLIVGSLATESVVRFHTNGDAPTTLIGAGSGFGDIQPAGVLALSNGSLLIADFDFSGNEPNGHHQILECDAATGANAKVFANFTATLGSGQQLVGPAQPEAMMLDADGNLLVGLSPDVHNGSGAVEELDIASGSYVATIASGIGTPSGLAYVPQLSTMSAAPADWPTSGPSALTLASDAYDQLHLYDSGGTNDAVPAQSLENVGNVQVTAPNNTANVFTIDSSELNSFIPPGGISFEGGSGSAHNTLSIQDSAGSNSYSLNGSQLTINGAPLVAVANTQAISLNLGNGSLDLSGAAISSFSLTSGTLKLPSATALPAGASLTIGANAANVLSAASLDRAPFDSSTGSEAIDAQPASVVSNAASPPAAPAAAAAAVQTTAALVSQSAAAAVSTAAQPAKPAASGPAAPKPSGTSAVLGWWNPSNSSSRGDGSTTDTDRRIAALDAVLTQYGNP